MKDINLNTVEEIQEAWKLHDQIVNNLYSRIKEAAEYLGIIDKYWEMEFFEIYENTIHVRTVDMYFDQYDAKTDTFPIWCIVSQAFLADYKQKRDAALARAEELKEKAENDTLREKELAELARLKEKYETEEFQERE